MVRVRGLSHFLLLAASISSAAAFGPSDLAGLRKTCPECVPGTPSAILMAAMDRYVDASRKTVAEAAHARFCYDFVKTDVAPPHRQHYCRVVSPCGYAEASHMAGETYAQVFYHVAALSGECSEATARTLRTVFLDVFLHCGSARTDAETRASIEANRFDFSAPPPAGADAAKYFGESLEKAQLPKACKHMFGQRILLNQPRAHETITLGVATAGKP